MVNLLHRKQYVETGFDDSKVVIVTFTTNKAMLCIWWDMEDFVYYELLKPNETITSVIDNN